MKAAYCTTNQENTGCAKLLGMTTQNHNSVLLGNNNVSLLISDNGDCLDECSFISAPSDDAIIAFCESSECAGSIAYSEGSSAGSVSVESCGAIASSSCGSSGGGGCDFSC